VGGREEQPARMDKEVMLAETITIIPWVYVLNDSNSENSSFEFVNRGPGFQSGPGDSANAD